MNLVSATAQVATHETGAPIYQTFVGVLGMIKTTCPFMGQVSHGVTDDMGNVVDINWAGLAASLSN